MDISGGTPPFSLGSMVIYHCDEGLFPLDVRTSTCTDMGGRGEWVGVWCAGIGQVKCMIIIITVVESVHFVNVCAFRKYIF